MTATATKPAARTLRYADGALTVTEGKAVECYRLAPVRSDDGRDVLGYRLTKRDGTTYDVDPAADTCECLGFLRWGYCRHLAAVNKLIALRLI